MRTRLILAARAGRSYGGGSPRTEDLNKRAGVRQTAEGKAAACRVLVACDVMHSASRLTATTTRGTVPVGFDRPLTIDDQMDR